LFLLGLFANLRLCFETLGLTVKPENVLVDKDGESQCLRAKFLFQEEIMKRYSHIVFASRILVGLNIATLFV
jgi:hypothetical protein